MSKTLELRVLGRLEIQQGGMPLTTMQADKTMALLSYLAVTGRSHTRSALAGLLWGDMPEARARGNLSKALSTLRQVDGDHLTITRQTASFNQDSHFWLDVTAFEAGVSDGSIESLQTAVGLYQGDFLDGFAVRHAPEFEAWVVTQGVRLKALALQALHTLAAHFAGQDNAGREQALAYTNHLLRLEPWREEAHRQMMELLARQGQRGAALAQYETCRRVLAEELAVEPGPATTDLMMRIRNGVYDVAANAHSAIAAPMHPSDEPVRYDLLEMPTIGVFFGRENELSHLNRWIVDEACHLGMILGVGGMGKTSLVARFVASLQAQAGNLKGRDRPFAKIIWRSLLNAPPLADVLHQSILFLSDQQIVDLPDSLDEQLRLLTKLFQQQRCLLVLDNAESIMQAGQGAGTFRTGYEGYGQLIERVAQSDHQSCLLLTSRERPKSFARLARDIPQVRSLQLPGLPDEDAQRLLDQQGLNKAEAQTRPLIKRYAGHPLALKLVAETIEDFYFGDIDAFLTENALIFADIGEVLDQQFARLSPLEQTIMTWLAIEREPVSVQTLSEDLLGLVSHRAFLEALRALQGRSLLEKQNDGFGLQNVITEYTTDRFIDQVCQELGQDVLDTFNRHALIKAQAKDYVRESQQRLILQPIAERLVARLGQAGLEKALAAMRETMRAEPSLAQGYAAGNMLNLLLHLGSDLRGTDFSGLVVRQAYLQGMALQDINFSQADLQDIIFTGTFGQILSVDISPDGRLIAAATNSLDVWVWRISDGYPVMIGDGHTSWIWSVCFSPDGSILASGCSDQTIRLWDVQTGQTLSILAGHTDSVKVVCFSPDGKQLASGSDDQTVRLWDIAPGDDLRTTHPVEILKCLDQIRAVTYSPDGSMLAGSSNDGTISLWNLQTNKIVEVLKGHSNAIGSVCFSPDGKWLASGGEDQTVRLWEVQTGQCLTTLKGHTHQVRSVVFSPDGMLLASGSEDQTVRLWDVKTEQTLRIMPHDAGDVTSICFSPDGKILGSGSWGQRVNLWDVQTGQILKTLKSYINLVWSVAFSPGGNKLASGNDDLTVQLWDVAALRASGGLAAMRPTTLQGHTHAVLSVCFSPDGTILASGSWDRTVRFWDVQTGRLLKILRGHSDKLWSIDFSPDGKLLASGSGDRTVRVWEVQTGQTLKILEGHTNRVNTVCFSPDGKLLASGSIDRTVRLWDVQTGQTLKILEGPNVCYHAIRFSPNGKLLAGGCEDQIVRLWCVQTGQMWTELQGHTQPIISLAFSPDGNLLASGSSDRTIRLWHVGSDQSSIIAQPLAILPGFAVAFSADGQYLAGSDVDAKIVLWDVDEVLQSSSHEFLEILRADRPYERMNITGVTGITEAQKATLKALGAVDLG